MHDTIEVCFLHRLLLKKHIFVCEAYGNINQDFYLSSTLLNTRYQSSRNNERDMFCNSRPYLSIYVFLKLLIDFFCDAKLPYFQEKYRYLRIFSGIRNTIFRHTRAYSTASANGSLNKSMSMPGKPFF